MFNGTSLAYYTTGVANKLSDMIKVRTKVVME